MDYQHLLTSQKIIWSLASSIRFNLPRGRVKLKEILLHILPNFQYCSHVTTPVTIVWSAKNGHHILFLQIRVEASNKYKLFGNYAVLVGVMRSSIPHVFCLNYAVFKRWLRIMVWTIKTFSHFFFNYKYFFKIHNSITPYF